jgi:hypothetical protein
MLTQLVYASEVRDLGPDGPQAVLDEARKRNSANQVTGILLYSDRQFLQCLEGGRRQVTETFSRILLDRRHKNVQLMLVADADRRDFGDWSMAYVQQTPDVKAALRQVMPTDEFHPELLTDRAVSKLLQRLCELHAAAG